jgi:hypothetical protein
VTEFGDNHRELLLLLSEQLKQPLVAIAHLSELEQGVSSAEIHAYARQALATIDAISLYQHIASGQQALTLEPVHVGSAIHEVAHSMGALHHVSGSSIEVDIQHGLLPVTTDRRVFVAALQSLWQAMLGSLSRPDKIVCFAHKTPTGVRLALRSASAGIQSLELSQINSQSSQPITGIAGPSADLLTSRAMFSLLNASITKSTSKVMTGLGVTLEPSHQLSII